MRFNHDAHESQMPAQLVVSDSLDGDAFIIIRDSLTTFARWLKKNVLGTRH